jgi:hypothetical protein
MFSPNLVNAHVIEQGTEVYSARNGYNGQLNEGRGRDVRGSPCVAWLAIG